MAHSAPQYTYTEIAQRGSRLMTDFIARRGKNSPPSFGDELGIAKAFYEMPGKLDQTAYRRQSARTCARHRKIEGS